ncbi:hypothetical protein L873DRAFT_153671 [Choiromyces venosus 120613-1]|uniref:Secreted protein n=1 Tax=Choiromyces venosus 120613-1 TaxID=1336337 RepID=A0A3N4JFP2_9PEZI|nr:hypothetical protein L873DRAFT_153671 [Choiromyces venosus 120613-1]
MGRCRPFHNTFQYCFTSSRIWGLLITFGLASQKSCIPDEGQNRSLGAHFASLHLLSWSVPLFPRLWEFERESKLRPQPGSRHGRRFNKREGSISRGIDLPGFGSPMVYATLFWCTGHRYGCFGPRYTVSLVKARYRIYRYSSSHPRLPVSE